MPRDLHAMIKDATSEPTPQLTKSPEEVEGQPAAADQSEAGTMDGLDSTGQFQTPGLSKRDELHPYTQSLSIKDVDSCTTLEAETFPPNERCTREKFQYRLKACGELSLGLFTSQTPNDPQTPITTPTSTASTASPVYSPAPHRKAVLLAHLIVTKTTHPTVQDSDMEIPPEASSNNNPSNPSNQPPNPTPTSPRGHNQAGRTLALHSLAVLPAYQNRGLGRTLLLAFLQRTEALDLGDRVALLAHEALVPFYEKFGFVKQGRSACGFGGGGWWDMVWEVGKSGRGE
ncbi:hypothetical protein B0A50_02288 [Salinomyces thailandicus]|uniref:N-acetyltransferase domain-containing protein n=1 Tax=Salinomyces thailandicus TaxID=706561 RepID=A0A4U0U839_9PEZI|nr:hypothetical protein B0A50_02288 [Salinomyces thailandica]